MYFRDSPLRGRGTASAEAVQAWLLAPQCSMQNRMLRTAHHLKIFWTIVQAVFVDMVNDFVSCKMTTDYRLHNDSMLKDVRTAWSRVGVIWRIDHAVPVSVHGGTALPRTAFFWGSGDVESVTASEPERLSLDPFLCSVSSRCDASLFAASTLTVAGRYCWGILGGHLGILSRFWGAMPRGVSAPPRFSRASIIASTSQKAVHCV